jgi:1-deoxy-D-xylulose-5-phosphate synthase
MRCIPNMVIASPMNEQELRNMMYSATFHEGGAYTIRYPRGQGVMPEWKTPFEKLETGVGRVVREGKEVAILTFGHIGNYAVKSCDLLATEDIYPAHYDMRFAKPLDEKLLHQIFAKFNKIVTVEDGCLMGGFGSAIIEFMADNNYSAKIIRLGMPDKVVEHGEQIELHAECGYDPEGIAQAVKKLVEKKPVKVLS